MLDKKPLTVAAFAMLAAAQPAAAAAPAGITYDCDTATERWSELILPAPPVPFTVTGEVRLKRIASLDRVAPVTRLMVSEAEARPGDSPNDFAGFSLLALPARKLGISSRDPKQVVQFVQWDEARGGTLAEHKAMPATDYGEGTLPFMLRFDGKAVTASIDGKETTIALAAKQPVVRVVCSTGEFLYTNLRIEPAS